MYMAAPVAALELARRVLLPTGVVVAALWLAGVDVEEVCGLGVLCARLVGAPFLGPIPDIVVWDMELGPVAELDAVWRRYAEGPSPALVVVSKDGPWCEQGHVLVCKREPAAILASVTRVLNSLQRAPLRPRPTSKSPQPNAD